MGSENRKLLGKLAFIAVCMFGFAYALVPFYQQICSATGMRNLLKPDVAANTQVDAKREVTIEFDANLRNDLPWRFKPERTRMVVHPGQLVQVVYDIENVAKRAVVGQAIPSYSPAVAASHFKKLDCFCFTQQRFAAGESRKMPVVFMVDPALPVDVNTITLSYSFFEVEGAAKTAS
ncbi:cytochrome c oxidase assembly protein [Chitinimonas sp.]|uniref:cytochrome c oxidase assembly protein n=1 Tax=Chitinimonas sp. TaxID=1934313 RepID=UPI0035B06B02